MDFGNVLRRAWDITWRWKALWILGFLAALGQGGGANTGSSFSGGNMQNGNMPNFDMPAGVEGLLIGLGCLALIIGLALWVVSIIARGGLIAGVAQVEDTGDTSFGRAWAVGRTRFWSLFGIGVLVALPIIILVVVMVVALIAVAGGTAALANTTDASGIAPLVGSLFACLCPSVCLLVLLSVVLGQIQLYAERAAVLEGLGWIDAFKRGWQVLRANLGPTVVLLVIFLVLGLIVAAITAAILAPVILPLMALSGVTGETAQNWRLLLVPICGVGLLATIVGGILGAIINTFTSATWTLAYRQFTAAPTPPAEPLLTEGPIIEG